MHRRTGTLWLALGRKVMESELYEMSMAEMSEIANAPTNQGGKGNKRPRGSRKWSKARREEMSKLSKEVSDGEE